LQLGNLAHAGDLLAVEPGPGELSADKSLFLHLLDIHLVCSGLHATWQQAHWLGWQHLGSGHLAVEQISFDCPQNVKKEQNLKENPFLLWLKTHN
jgi:hypothetical protein